MIAAVTPWIEGTAYPWLSKLAIASVALWAIGFLAAFLHGVLMQGFNPDPEPTISAVFALRYGAFVVGPYLPILLAPLVLSVLMNLRASLAGGRR